MSIVRWSCPLTQDQAALLLTGLPATLAKLRAGHPDWEPAYQEAASRHDARSINVLTQWSENLVTDNASGIARSYINTALVPFPFDTGPKDPEYIPDVLTYLDILCDIREIPMLGMFTASHRLAREKVNDGAFDLWCDLVKWLDEHTTTELEPVDQAHVDAWRDR